MNTNNDLNSALALFRSLFKAQKGDIYTIIDRFILVGVKSKGLMSFSNEEIAKLLKEMFNLDIPFSVIQRCIVSNQEVFRYSRGKYVVNNPMDEEIDRIIEEMTEIEAYKASVISELAAFLVKKGLELSDEDKVELGNQFFDFVIDKDHSQESDYKLYITRFIIEKEKDDRFQRFLNSIREGMVIYKGIRYSESPNDASWECTTDFFLDQEYLFSAYGMNGAFYEKYFFEFYNLVDEINKASKLRGGRDRIRLFYFTETKSDIESYFEQAIRIRRMLERYNYPQVAMDSILNSCKEDVDIEHYKSDFYRKLKRLHIEEYSEEIDLRRNQEYLFENEEFEKEKDKRYTLEQLPEVNDYVKIADYINILREGKRCLPLEKSRYIFLSDGNLSNDLSRFIREFYSEKKPIVITRMGNFTELMWFKLKKGVVDTNSTVTINVINKAKTVVSGLLHDNLKKQYDAVLALDEDENTKRAYYADLRSKRYSPDEINGDTIAEDIAFIEDPNYLEKYKQSQQILKSQAAKVEVLEKELEQERTEKAELEGKMDVLERYVKNEKRRKLSNAISEARRKIGPRRVFFKYYIWLLNIMLLAAFVVPSVFWMTCNWVNIATVIGTYIAVVALVNTFFKNKKAKIRQRFQKKYSKILSEKMKKIGL